MTVEPLRCLSVRQPWAWAICTGGKTVENRTWQTPYRGLIAIHAGASTSEIKVFRQNSPLVDMSPLKTSAIIGVAEITAVEELNPAMEDNPFACGPFCWELTNARLLKTPIPAKGKLNLYNLPPELSAEVRGAELLEPAQARRPKLLDAVTPATDFVEFYLNSGAFFADREDYAATIRAATNALRLSPQNAEAFVMRGHAHYEMEQDDQALADILRGVELAPDSAFAHAMLGLMYLTRAEFEEAGKAYAASLKCDGDYEMALVGEAVVALQREDFPTVLTRCNQVLAASPEHSGALITRGEALAATGKLTEALADADTVLAAQPENQEAAGLRQHVLANM